MFSRLETYFKASDRRTEAIDTRMAIRRDEQQAEDRPPRGKKPPPPSEEFGEDSLTVSLPGLMAFLQELLPAADPLPEKSGAGAPSAQDTEPRAPANPQRARAAAAYQSTQDHSNRTQKPLRRGHDRANAPDLTPEEEKNIKELLAALHTLANRNVETLSIARSDNLLYSLRQAINAAQTS